LFVFSSSHFHTNGGIAPFRTTHFVDSIGGVDVGVDVEVAIFVINCCDAALFVASSGYARFKIIANIIVNARMVRF
jgi:hypothetical protein